MVTTTFTKGHFSVTPHNDGRIALSVDGIVGMHIDRTELPDLLHALLVIEGEPLTPASVESHDCSEGAFWRERWLEQNKLYAALAVRQAKLERLITSLEVLRSAATRYHGSRELEEQTRAKHQSAPSTAAWQIYTAASDHRRRCHQELEAAALQYAAATNHIDGRVVR